MAAGIFQLEKLRFKEITEQIADLPILVVGDVGIDRYTQGEATRLNPEAPVPIVSVEQVHNKLGLAANVANNLAAFAAKPLLAGMIGDDQFAADLYGMLDECGVDRTLVLQSKARRTTVKERVIAMGQQVVRVDHEIRHPLASEDARTLIASIEKVLPSVKAIVIEDYAKGIITKELSQELIALAKKHNILVSVDPPSTSDRSRVGFYKGATMVTPNLREAERLYGNEIHTEEDLQACGLQLMEDLACEVLVVTRGKDGMTLFSKTEGTIHVPTFAREVFDVSGAGDTVIAMLTAAIAAGVSLKESAILANYAAGAGVGIPGTAVISIPELDSYIKQVNGFSD